MRSLLAAMLFVALALAGCSSGGHDGAEDDPTADLGLEATDTTGVIRGVVVNEAIVPIAGVTLTLQTGQSATSNAEGAFGFQDLDPGTYFIAAKKLGYASIQQSAEVVAGDAEPPVVKIQLARDSSTLPSYELFEFHGYLECNVAIPFFFFPCQDPITGDPIGSDDFDAVYNITGNVSFIHTSLVWDASQPVGTELYMNVGTPSEEIVGYTGGPSPQVVDIGGNDTKQFDNGAVVVEVSGNGEQGLAGAEYQQRFDAYVVVFHGFLPPEGYAFWRDGPPQLPY